MKQFREFDEIIENRGSRHEITIVSSVCVRVNRRHESHDSARKTWHAETEADGGSRARPECGTRGTGTESGDVERRGGGPGHRSGGPTRGRFPFPLSLFAFRRSGGSSRRLSRR